MLCRPNGTVARNQSYELSQQPQPQEEIKASSTPGSLNQSTNNPTSASQSASTPTTSTANKPSPPERKRKRKNSEKENKPSSPFGMAQFGQGQPGQGQGQGRQGPNAGAAGPVTPGLNVTSDSVSLCELPHIQKGVETESLGHRCVQYLAQRRRPLFQLHRAILQNVRGGIKLKRCYPHVPRHQSQLLVVMQLRRMMHEIRKSGRRRLDEGERSIGHRKCPRRNYW